jgi:hypothetical protein
MVDKAQDIPRAKVGAVFRCLTDAERLAVDRVLAVFLALSVNLPVECRVGKSKSRCSGLQG